MAQDKFLTPPEIAKRLRCSPDQVRGWIEAGELVGSNLAAKVGTRPRWRVAESDLADFLRRRAAFLKPSATAHHRRRKPTAERRYF